MEKIIKEGKDLEEILTAICEEYDIAKEDFYYKAITHKNGLFNKNTFFEVECVLKKDLLLYIKSYLEELLTNMGLEVNFETKLRDDVMYVKIYSNHNSVLIGKNGNTLKSLEHLIRQKIKLEFDIYPYVSLDIENYREKKEKRLEHMAKRLAKEVVSTKVPVEMDNMNAYDRRIVHNALTNFKGVSTESTGEEPNRHVVIKPL